MWIMQLLACDQWTALKGEFWQIWEGWESASLLSCGHEAHALIQQMQCLGLRLQHRLSVLQR